MADRIHPVDQQPLRPLPTDLSDVPLHDEGHRAAMPLPPPQLQQHRERVQIVCQSPPDQKTASGGATPALRKDVIYKTPPPLPADHPSTAKRRRLSPCCCCLAWLCSLLVSVVIVIGIAALVFYLVVQPRMPKYAVQDLSVSRFNVTTQPLNATSGTNATADAPYLNSDIQLTISAQNPNKKIGLFYDEVQISVTYEGVSIGQDSIPPFYQGHKNTTILSLDLKGSDIALKQTVGAKLNASLTAKSDISLQIETTAHVAVKIGSWKSSDMTARLLCSVVMTAPTSGTPKVVSRSCELKHLSA